MRELGRSDLFLCFLGDRYGWQPDVSQVPPTTQYEWMLEHMNRCEAESRTKVGQAISPSITELEATFAVHFLHSGRANAHLAEKPTTTREQRSRLFFYFRSTKAIRLLA